LAKRVFEIAKEMGIASKAIVEKCQAEGIPESIIKNHMSTVSIGLEATIREWFSTGSNATAVETAAPVDIEHARARPARKRADGGHDEPAGEGGAATATKVAPAEHESSGTAARAARPLAVPSRPAARTLTPARPIAPAAPAAPTTPSAPAAPAAPEQPSEPPSIAPPLAPAASVAAPAQPEAPEKTTERPSEARRDHGTGGAGGAGAPPASGPRPSAIPPAPRPRMNVPERPQIVRPAGPQLQAKTPVRLSGPKIVRVEAPEVIDAPRPRGPRPPGGGGGGGPGAPGQTGAPGRGGRGERGREGGEGESDAARRGGGARRGGSTRRRGDAYDVPAGSTAGWTEQDLAEREARLARASGLLKKRRANDRSSGGGGQSASPAEVGGTVRIAEPFTIKDLSATTGVKAADIVKKLFMQGIMATINSGIDAERAQEIMLDYNIDLEVTEQKTAEEAVHEEFGADRDAVDQRARGPVVTILGHVDHGKTSLLDRIRNANVASGEAGGITQATSAFRVPVRMGDDDKYVVFVDTPGHEAFTAMRSRGASITDLAVLVVAADDGVMPQTIESISHAKAAGVPIVVALNKIDKAEATEGNIQRILGQLAEHELNPAEWGGDTEVVRTSATSGTGVQDLLEVLDYQAQLLDLKADFKGPARGTVIEARTMEGRGAVANILVQDGELKVGDFVVMGRAFGRVRDITDDRGNRLKSVHPPLPVQISGIDEVPDAGDKFYIVDSLKKAQEAAEQRRMREREKQLAQPKVTLDSLFNQMAESELKEILIVLKVDVQGSLDVLKHEIEKVSTSEVKVRVLHSAIGGITESDVLLAEASKAIIVGFNVIPSGKARSMAESKGVEIRTYDVIYHITEDIKKAAEGMLEPELRQQVLGHAEVRQVFKVTRVGAIAGCYITDGTVERDALVRVTRGGIVVENDRRLEQLKRFKDDAKEVRAGMECGMKIVGYDDIKEGDVIECYKNVEVKRSL
jgi:translation initiation factor IF-2